MTLNTTYSPTVADGNGVTKSFSYSFNPISENYLKVSLEQNGSWVEQVSGWTATVSENGGVVTFDTAPTTRVAIERDVPEEQPTSYKTSSGFQAQVIEHSFDMLTGMVQELKEKSDRSIAVDVGSSVNPQEVVAQVERVYDSIDNIDTVAGDLTNIDAVNANKDNIDIVAGDKANIDIVATNKTNVDKVANNIGSVNRVSPYINQVVTTSMIASDIVRVAQISSDVTAVNANKTNIDIVANNKSDVNTVANNISSVVNVGYNVNHISRVDANKDNIDAVADDITNVNRVGGSINNVNSVAAGLDDISDVLDNMTNIDTVAGSITNVSRVGNNINKVVDVADDLTNIDAVNANKTNIDIVASNNANVSRVGSNINNVNTVANSETDINTIADNISDVNNVASYLGNISAVASGITEVQAVADDLNNIDGVSQYLGQIENVSDNISNVNEVGSNIANVNTVAGDHTNIQTVVTNLSAIRAAPANAAQAQQWAIGVPGEPSGGSAKYWAERAEDAASGMENPANRDLSNLTADGQMIIDTIDGKISNCILDIPQNIKLELNNNVLTLKAGSTVVNGQAVYTTVTTTEDKNNTISAGLSGRYLVFVRVSDWAFVVIKDNRCVSGETDSLAELAENHIWLDTTAKEVNMVFSAGGKAIRSYPLCVVDVVGGVASFAKDSNGNDMIFNGMGFIGHHIFIYPNINAYKPAELNPDGSLASTKVNTNALRIIEALSGYGYDSLKRWISLQSNHTVSNWSGYIEVNHDSEADYSIANIRYYARDINLIKRYNSGSVSAVDGVPLVEYYYDGSNITSFTPKQCVRLATVDMLPDSYTKGEVDTKLASKQDTLVSGTNIKTINNTTVLGNGNFALADQSLSNLDSNGQMIIDSQNGTISNCVLDVPQNIKLELSNNVLTLKAGSTVVLTNRSVYTTRTTTQDYSVTFPSSLDDGRYWATFTGTFLTATWLRLNATGSGTSLPADNSQYSLFFLVSGGTGRYYNWNMNTNSWNYWNNDGSYPLCVINVVDGVASFAKDSKGRDMIFNGAGFVGHHAFVYPNVASLRPNKKDIKERLQSYYNKTNAVIILELNASSNMVTISGNSQGVVRKYKEVDVFNPNDTSYFQYVKPENADYFYSSSGWAQRSETPFIEYSYNGTTVTDFAIRQPVRTATVEMLNNKQDVLTFDSTPTASSTNPVTSGSVYTALGTKQDVLTFDSTPTQNSTNPVTSGGIYSYIGNKFQVVSSLPANPDANTFYFIVEEEENESEGE